MSSKIGKENNHKVCDNHMKNEVQSSILWTKLFAPSLRKDIVERIRLIEQLAIFPGHRLSLICAPAGYGKTTLAKAWLQSTQMEYTWISLDGGDNDPLRFFNYFIEGLQKIQKEIGNVAKALIHTPNFSMSNTLINELLNDIAHLQGEFVIVLDDYHVIKNKIIHEVVQYLLNHQPPMMHVIILTREEPPLAISRLRARGQLVEVNMIDLCFTNEESEEFFKGTMQVGVNKDDIHKVNSRTEGWITGLQLAALSMQRLDADKLRNFVSDFSGSNRYIVDYLLEEVLEQLDSELILFLYQTSILNRFTASFCDEIMGIKDSQRKIELLYKMNLFIVDLDDKEEWYRYHHLFAEFLSRGVSKLEKRHLLLKASHWCEENGYLFEAVEYALLALDMEEAERLIEKACEDTILQIEFSTMLRWSNSLPKERLFSNEKLCVFSVWSKLLLGRFEEALSDILELEDRKGIIENPIYYGTLLGIKSNIYVSQGNREALHSVQKAIELVGGKDLFFRALALQNYGNYHDLFGNTTEAEKAYKELMDIAQRFQYHTARIVGAYWLALCFVKQGRIKEVEELCAGMLREYSETREKMLSPLLLYIPLGMSNYINDNLVEAEGYLSSGIKILDQLDSFLHLNIDAEWVWILLQYELGDYRTANRKIKQLQQRLKEIKAYTTLKLLDALEIEIHLREGNLKAVLQWINKSKLRPDVEILPILESQYFTYVRVLNALGQGEEARKVLVNLERFAMERQYQGSLIVVYLLRAKIEKLCGNVEEALKYLHKAVKIAAPRECYRYFLNEGPVICEMLVSLREVESDFVNELLKRFKKGINNHKDQIAVAVETSVHTKVKKSSLKPLLGILTNKEREILELISHGLSTREISNMLFITVGTVSTHINNVYSKLSVNRRTQAVAKAKELGIL